MRKELIIRFFCARCGKDLEVPTADEPYGEPRTDTAAENARMHKDGDPTGALVRYMEPVYVAPCEKCIDEITAPAKAMAKAVAQMAHR